MLWNNLISWLHSDSECNIRRAVIFTSSMHASEIRFACILTWLRRTCACNPQWVVVSPENSSLQTSDMMIRRRRSTRADTHFFFLCFAKLFIIINSLWARFNLNRRVGTQLKTYKNSSFGRKNEFCWLKPRSYVPNDTSRTKSRNDLAYSQIRFISLDHCGCSTLPSRTCRQLYIEQKCATYAIQWGGGKNRYLKINMFCLHISLFQSKPTQIFERIIFVFFLSRQFDRITIRTMSAGAPCSIYSFIYK